MNNKKQTLLQQLLNGVLIVAILGTLGFLSLRYKIEADWTAGGRNTLTESSRKLLDSMPDPIKFTVFIYPNADDRRSFDIALEKYRREKSNIEAEFIDPSANPGKVKEYNVTTPGEVIVEYQGRRENLRLLSEPSITSALQRLSYAGEQWIVFLEGHGERSTTEDAPDAYTQFAATLRDKGLKVQPLNLVKTPQIPDNASVLVIASPKSALFDGEIKLVDEYVKKGGNLLWLADPDQKAGLETVAQTLGVSWQNGYAVFPDYQILGTGHPGFYAAVSYPQNAVTRGLDQVTLFPLVRSLKATAQAGWQVQPLLESSEAAWLETGAIDDTTGVDLDPAAGDIPGPLSIGITLTHELAAEKPQAATEGAAPPQGRTQRVALIGDADFLSNAFLNEYGNRQLGQNLVQWLASRDAQLNVDIPKAPDTSLLIPPWATYLIAFGFILVLPLLLIGTGVSRWIMRRRR